MMVAFLMRIPRKPVGVFVSSPGDVSEERRITEEVLLDLNRLVGPRLGITLEPMLWEDAVPDMGPPQVTINRQFPDCEIFIGIVWARFGSPTARFGSGTEEEFSIAHTKWRGDGVPRILFYLCSREIPYPNDEATVSQLLQVVQFRKDLKGKGLVSTYVTLEQFRTLLWEHLFQVLYDMYGERPAAAQQFGQAPNRFREFHAKLDQFLWLCYSPVDFDPDRGIYPGEESLRRDLKTLSDGPFTGIITFGSENTLSSIPRIARECGIRGVIMGIYRPDSNAELEAAIRESDYVDGYCIGHLALHEFCSDEQLLSVLKQVRETTTRPVTTTERISEYIRYPAIEAAVDWFFPDVHYYWHQGVSSVEDAVEEFCRVAIAAGQLVSSDKRILMKMVSFPSDGGPGLSIGSQAAYFSEVSSRLKNDSRLSRTIRCAFFEAFDSGWKTSERGWSSAEQCAGLYDIARKPKPAVASFPDWRRTR